MQIVLTFCNDFRRLLIAVYQKTEDMSGKKESENRKQRGAGKHHNLLESVYLLHSACIFCTVKLRHKPAAGFGKCSYRYQKEKGKLVSDIDRAHFYVAQSSDHKIIDQRNEALYKSLNHYGYGKSERLAVKMNRPKQKSFMLHI